MTDVLKDIKQKALSAQSKMGGDWEGEWRMMELKAHDQVS